MNVALYAAAIALFALSGVPGLVARAASGAAHATATGLAAIGALTGLVSVAVTFVAPDPGVLPLGLVIASTPLAIRLDALSAIFAAPLFLIGGFGAIYGSVYWTPAERPRSVRQVRLFFGLMVASIGTVFAAVDGITLLFAWEIMAIAAFFLVTADAQAKGVLAAGRVFLYAAHVCVLALMGLFTLLASETGSYTLDTLATGVARGPMGPLFFVLTIAGFGFKAGVMPLHFWLPGAHAAAPSHVSALMSGVLIKTGVYGIVRVLTLFPDPPLWWGGTVFALGAISGVLGVAFALGQHDLKRLLAYHSIENIGIILMGLGLGLLGRAAGRPEWVVLGFAGGLLHVVNHGLFKSLLFFGAGAVVHATGTRTIDRLGGLARRMPRSAFGFLVGAIAISGLPPLNGFVSEWLIYLGLCRTIVGEDSRLVTAAGAVGVPALALIGALALACFVKAYGVVFLGEPRSAEARDAHEAPSRMTAPMFVLVLLCATIGLAPFALAAPLDDVIRILAGPRGVGPSVTTLAPLGTLGLVAAVFLGATVLLWLWLRHSTRAAPRDLPTWDCGYAAPTARMQYTASSFADWIVGFFHGALRPERHVTPLRELFVRTAHFEDHVPDVVLDKALGPVLAIGERLAVWSHALQRGHVQIYLLYILVTLVALLFTV